MDTVGELFVVGESFRELTEWKPRRIRRICAGYGSAACVVENEIYSISSDTSFPEEGIVECAFGENENVLCSDLSGGTWVKKSGSWLRLQVPWKAHSIASGSRHFAVCTELGDVFTWGRGFEGQLGHPQDTMNDLPKPKLVTSLCSQRIVRVACGHNFTMALTDEGALWAWGEGRCGELGLGTRQTIVRSPARIEKRWKRVACGWAHVLAIDENDRLYSWGFNGFGQLGFVSQDASSVLSPRLVSSFETKATKIAATGNFSAAVDSTGSVYVWGLLHDKTSTANPTLIEQLRGRRIAGIAASSGSQVFVFSPAVVTRAEPPSIPKKGGSVLLRGTGLWNPGEDEGLLQVKFEDDDKNVHTAPGVFVEPDGVRAEIPPDCFSNSSSGITARVSMNGGKDWAISDIEPIALYDEPELTGLSSPMCCFNSGENILEITTTKWPQGVDIGLVRVSLDEEDVVGWLREDDDGNVTVCSKIHKLFECEMPASLRIGVAVNGQDYVYLEERLTVHEADLISLSPETCSLSKEPILLRGKCFFSHAQIVVRFFSSDPHDVTGTFVDDTTIEVMPPPEFDDEERVRPCQVGLSLDGGRSFLDSTLPLSIFAQLTPEDVESMSPLSGPANGGTRVQLKLPEDYLFEGALVKFQPISDVDYFTFAEATVRTVVEEGCLTFEAPAVMIVAAAPSPSPAPDEAEADGVEQATTREEEEEEGEEEGKKTFKASVEIALDGIHYFALAQNFELYENPIVTRAERLEDGKVILTGNQFLLDRTALVKVESGDGRFEEYHVAAKDENTIDFDASPTLSQEDDDEAGENVERRESVRVSFNDGCDFTSSVDIIDESASKEG